MFTLQIVVDGVTQVLTAFSRFAEYADDMSSPYASIADDFQQVYMQDVFGSEGATNGESWAPLSPGYEAQKNRAFPGMPILVRTGNLADSLMGGAGAVREITPTSLIVGTSIPYAAFHQHGTSRMPMRKIIDVPVEVRWRWAKMVHLYLVEKAHEVGLGMH